MRPTTYDLDLYRGDSYEWAFDHWDDDAKTQPSDLIGVVAAAEIRDQPGGDMIMTLACTISGSRVTVNLPASEWENWTSTSCANAVWDLQLTYLDGSVLTSVAGAVTITNDVTDSDVLAELIAASAPTRRVN